MEWVLHPCACCCLCCNDAVCFDAQKGQCAVLQLSLAPRTVLAEQYWCTFSDICLLLFSPGETSLSNMSIKCKRLNTFYWGFNQSGPQDCIKATEIGRLTGIQQGHNHSNALAGSNGYNFTTLLKEIQRTLWAKLTLAVTVVFYRAAQGRTWWMWSFLCN